MKIALTDLAIAAVGGIALPGETFDQTLNRILENLAVLEAEDFAHFFGIQKPNLQGNPDPRYTDELRAELAEQHRVLSAEVERLISEAKETLSWEYPSGKVATFKVPSDPTGKVHTITSMKDLEELELLYEERILEPLYMEILGIEWTDEYKLSDGSAIQLEACQFILKEGEGYREEIGRQPVAWLRVIIERK